MRAKPLSLGPEKRCRSSEFVTTLDQSSTLTADPLANEGRVRSASDPFLSPYLPAARGTHPFDPEEISHLAT